MAVPPPGLWSPAAVPGVPVPVPAAPNSPALKACSACSAVGGRRSPRRRVVQQPQHAPQPRHTSVTAQLTP